MGYNVITTQAPAKLILSGEHAVVYNQPALAIGVNRFATTTIHPHIADNIKLNLLNLNYNDNLTFTELKTIYHQIKYRYQEFLAQNLPIASVLTKPHELAVFALGYCLETFELRPTAGLAITIHSTIPIGCGMGSSAAIIISLLYAITNFFNLTLCKEACHKIGCTIENMQHGCSSGIDLYLALHGGGVLFTKHHGPEPRNIPSIPIMAINTGKPSTSTGECVARIKTKISNPHVLANFSAITQAMDIAIQQNNIQEIQRCMQKNHALLNDIGVIPHKVNNFITAVNQAGNAAKISGAGATLGNNAGIVLIVGNNDITDLVKDYGYEIIPLKGETHGIRYLRSLSTRQPNVIRRTRSITRQKCDSLRHQQTHIGNLKTTT